ncbi:SusD family protein [Chitinophaga rupis]|uniref:SusD family protein n=1 Tax=Chitinophaga rupis TaxID=573321 RepID=A0A1H7P991_9BACT|nr:RagB/SusD family nutrient uptake outer membrane protein [Chitinophaga rupis]SEL32313.1 SusD family protein [Chitinophaga rupis]
MNRIIYISVAALFILLTGAGCRKYVEIDQVGTRTLHYTKDFQALLNYSQVMERTYYYPEMASDEVNISDTNYQRNMRDLDVKAYTWAPEIFIDVNDGDWDGLYKQVYYCNLVTAGVLDSDGGTETEKRNIYAQALVHRAYAFYTLVNIYAKQYDAATAANDPGVPVLTVPDFTGSLKRASVKEVYDLVKNDLQAALPELADVASYSSIPSRAAVYAILARASLQQGLYADAGKYADSALARQHTLLNLADYADNAAGLPLKLQDPEIIFLKSMTLTLPTFPLSDDLLALLPNTDLRYTLFTADGANFPGNGFVGRGYYRPRINSQGVYTGPCVPEMMLIKAESEARAGNVAPALDVLNELRKHRYKPADYTDLRVTDAKAALRQVVNERSRELMGRGFRWFDQKRLNREADFATTVTRSNFRGQTYTLAPNSNRYVFPIANVYIKLNPEITPNPR